MKPKTNPKWPVIVGFLNFSGLSMEGKHLIRFQSEAFVFKFLRRSVHGPWRITTGHFDHCSVSEASESVQAKQVRFLHSYKVACQIISLSRVQKTLNS